MDSYLKATLTELVSKLKTFISSNYTPTSSLKSVATSGSYNDLTDKPTKTSDFINDGDEGGSSVDPFVKQSEIVQSDWKENDNTDNSFIQNRTHYYTIVSGSVAYTYADGQDVTYTEDGNSVSYRYVSANLSDIDDLNIREFSYTLEYSGQVVGSTTEYLNKNNLITISSSGVKYGGYDDDGEYIILKIFFETYTEGGNTYQPGIYVKKVINSIVDLDLTDFSISEKREYTQLDPNFIPDSAFKLNNLIDGAQPGAVRGLSTDSESASYIMGHRSMAIGYGTKATHANQFVFGKYNIADSHAFPGKDIDGDYIEIVGNGSSYSSRSNARTLDWDGNEILAGDLKVGNSSGNGTITANSTLLIGKTSGRCDITLATSTGTQASSGKINICPGYNSNNPSSPINGELNIISNTINFTGSIENTKWNNIGVIGAGNSSDSFIESLENSYGSVPNSYIVRAQVDQNASSPTYPKLFLISDAYNDYNSNGGSGGHIHIASKGCDINDSSATPNYSYINIFAESSANDYAEGQIIIKAEGGTNAGSLINISALTNVNSNGNQPGTINITAGYDDGNVKYPGCINFDTNGGYVDFINAGTIKGIKKEISITSCTPDTYFCPTTAINDTDRFVLDDTNFTGSYNYTFSGYFTNASSNHMTDMPDTTSSSQNINVTWFGDIGLEASKNYMFCATKVSATNYVGVVTKLE